MWIGRGLTAAVVLMLLFSASLKLSHPAGVVEMFVSKLGYPAGILPWLAALEISVALIYAFPRTAALGAILVTGYLGGAIASHVRIGEPFVIPLALGVAAWAGLYLRDARLHALLPLRAAGEPSRGRQEKTAD